MNIAMINGSPKLSKSNSGFMLKALKASLPIEHNITLYNISKKPLADEQYIELCHVDVLVFAFPLYIDAIPSHLFRMLVALEGYLKAEMKEKISVYILVNNGFYEGHQNYIAIEIMKNWCKRCELHFGQGIGQGAGEMLGFMQDVPFSKGPLKNLAKAVSSLSNNIVNQSTGELVLLNPIFPHFAWIRSAHFFWHSQAKQNGLKRKDIVRKIEKTNID